MRSVEHQDKIIHSRISNIVYYYYFFLYIYNITTGALDKTVQNKHRLKTQVLKSCVTVIWSKYVSRSKTSGWKDAKSTRVLTQVNTRRESYSGRRSIAERDILLPLNGECGLQACEEEVWSEHPLFFLQFQLFPPRQTHKFVFGDPKHDTEVWVRQMFLKRREWQRGLLLMFNIMYWANANTTDGISIRPLTTVT